MFFSLPDETLGPALFTVTGNQGQGWRPANVRFLGNNAIKVNSRTPQVSLYVYSCVCTGFTSYAHLYSFQFAIVGTYGETAETDIAIDAVCIMTCTGEKSTCLICLLAHSEPSKIWISCVGVYMRNYICFIYRST